MIHFTDMRTAIEDVKLLRHVSLVAAQSAMWQCPVEELVLSTIGGADANGNEYEVPFTDAMETMSTVGIWGFADNNNQTLNYWLDPSLAEIGNVVHFFAHELAHLFLEKLEPTDDEIMGHEFQSETVGYIANKAMYLALSLTVRAAGG